MKAKFSVSGTLTAKDGFGIERIETPMLLVTKFAGMNLSRDYADLEAATGDALKRALHKNSFTGELGEYASVKTPDGCLPDRILLVGLGRAQQFSCAGVRELVKTAINAAVRRKVSRISIPVVPNRTTRGNLTLSSTAYIMKSVASDVLEKKKGDGEFEIELVCSAQAKRHLQAGLRRQRRKTACDPCAE